MRNEERRGLALAAAGVEIRAAAGEGAAERFVGRACVYGIRAPIGDPKTWGFFEEFAPGTFTDSLDREAGDDQRMLIDHDSYYLCSRVSAGDLLLTETEAGVDVDSGMDDELSYVRDLKVNVRKRRLTGMSIGFIVEEDRWSTIDVEEAQPDGKVRVYTAELRTILKGRLIEVSAVTWPAFVDTEANLRYGVAPALARRGDLVAVERRASHRPELAGLLEQLRATSNPTPTRSTTGELELLDRVLRSYATRYRPGTRSPG